jgi:amino acid transporter
VKQAIAWQRIFPFSNFFGRQDKQFDSPGGALFLHWIFTVIALLSFSPKLDSRIFASGIYLYGYQLIMGETLSSPNSNLEH